MHRTLLFTAALVSASSAGAQSVTIIPELRVNDVRPVAAVDVAGRTDAGAARWNPTTGLTVDPGATSINAIAPLGLSACGFDAPGSVMRALRYNIVTGWTPLPAPPDGWPALLDSNAFGISDDGVDVLGFARFADGPFHSTSHAFRWSALTGVSYLTTPGGLDESSPWAISGDGERIVGWFSPGGSGARAAYWDREGAVHEFLPPSFSEPSVAQAIDGDGTHIVGIEGGEPFLWIDGEGAVTLPTPPGAASTADPVAVSDDATIVVGNDGPFGDAWIWTPGQGTRWIRDVAAQLELSAGATSDPFAKVKACTPDGLRIVGTQPAAAGIGSDTWVLDLPPGGVGLWNDLGNGLAGTTKPSLVGFGALAPDTPGRMEIDAAAPFAPVTVVVGFTQAGVPFKGGVLVPSPDLLVDVSANAAGVVKLPFTWPAGIPSGTSLFFQAWTPDAGAPKGLAASNALEAVTP